MAKEYFHGGSVYSTDPVYKLNPYGSFTGYRGNFGSLSSAIDPRTANQLKEISETLNTGIRNIEMGPVDPNVTESIPIQHFQEMRRAAKLAGAELSFHAPMIDPTGITDRGWQKMNQEFAERQLWDAIKKSQELNPKGTVVTFHASSVGLPGAEFKVMDDKGKVKTESRILIGPDGQLGQIREVESYFPMNAKDKIGEKIPFNIDDEMGRKNDEAWSSQLSNLGYLIERGKNALEHMSLGPNAQDLAALEKEQGKKAVEVEAIRRNASFAKSQMEESYRMLKAMYDLAHKADDPEINKKLDAFGEKIKTQVQSFQDMGKDPAKLIEFSQAIQEGLDVLSDIPTPKLYQPIRDFAIERSAETTANLAWRGYQEFAQKGKEAPIIALENHPAQTSLITTGEDLRDVVEKARKEFVNLAMDKGGLKEKEARQQAEKLIGATWDVGHINMLRKYGFGEEEILKQTKAVAGVVKKVHLSDNFGFEHTELPMGMGNVPIEKIMANLGKEGYDAKKVIEAGNWWQHFSQGTKANGPLVPSLVGFGVPVYTGAYNASANPGWNQMYGAPAGYFSGYGTMLPDMNFQTYGAGFTSLPAELGGQIATKDSRFSGTPMA